ncbi:MAG: single-stranded-DNA-specific exonuclease RecJ [Eubacterium sp.]|nr:single-stranded-DNA-specific exonuclease RecJ [Eubacterium sp.]
MILRKERWMLSNYPADFRKIGQEFDIDPMIAKMIVNRGMKTTEEIRTYLSGGKESLNDPASMKGMQEAVSLLADAIRTGRKIRIIGDYDIDGVMSSYILLTALTRLGADADVRIPERIRDGYGLNEHLVSQAAVDGRDFLLTCDNGISAFSQIELAKELGMTVIVTDHHDIPFELEEADGKEKKHYKIPPADAVIDPKQEDCAYPFPGLCGAAVAWKLMQELYRKAGRQDDEIFEWIEYVGIATVGDVMVLKGENRVLVRMGLEALHHTRNIGLLELIRQNKLEPEKVDAYHIGFVIGPCLNASGRLDTAQRALNMLLETDRLQAAKLAGELVSLNSSRKDMTQKGVDRAVELVETTDLADDKVLVIYLPDLHESIAGIVAGKVRERFNKPVFVLTRARAEGTEERKEAEGTGSIMVKGSGRSIEAYHMSDELNKVDDLLLKYGGHPMAAGLSLKEENVDEFRRKLNENTKLTEEDLTPEILIDSPMPLSYISPQLIHQLDLLKPFGNGNEKPVFAVKGVSADYVKLVGQNKNVLQCRIRDQKGTTIGAVCFREAEEFNDFLTQNRTFDILYYPAIDSWNGSEKTKIIITGFRAAK